MIGPTPRQQAGYLRRLLRRGEIEVTDPHTGLAQPVMVELCGEVIRLVPLSPDDEAVEDLPEESLRWAALLARLRRALPVEEAEALADAVEAEVSRKGEQAAS